MAVLGSSLKVDLQSKTSLSKADTPYLCTYLLEYVWIIWLCDWTSFLLLDLKGTATKLQLTGSYFTLWIIEFSIHVSNTITSSDPVKQFFFLLENTFFVKKPQPLTLLCQFDWHFVKEKWKSILHKGNCFILIFLEQEFCLFFFFFTIEVTFHFKI